MARPQEREHGDSGAGTHPSRRSPIDLVHLCRQTAGNAALETEVLGLLVIQIERVRPVIETACESERKRLAHALKGASRNLGAFCLADAAEHLEQAPGDQAAMAALLEELENTGRFAREMTVG